MLYANSQNSTVSFSGRNTTSILGFLVFIVTDELQEHAHEELRGIRVLWICSREEGARICPQACVLEIEPRKGSQMRPWRGGACACSWRKGEAYR